jgi:hypothetical protein
VAEELDKKLRQWQPATVHEVEQRVEETIESADVGTLNLLRSRTREQAVLDFLDEPAIRSGSLPDSPQHAEVCRVES